MGTTTTIGVPADICVWDVEEHKLQQTLSLHKASLMIIDLLQHILDATESICRRLVINIHAALYVYARATNRLSATSLKGLWLR